MKHPKVKTGKEDSISYFRLFEYSTTLDKLCILIGAVCSVLSGLMQPYSMILFGDVTGAIVTYAFNYNQSLSQEQKDVLAQDLHDAVWSFTVQSIGIGFGVIIVTYISTVLLSYSCIRQILRIRKKFLDKTLDQDIAWFDMNQTGDFSTTFTYNISKIEDGIGDKIATFIFFECTVFAGIILAFIKGWKLALVCMVSLPLNSTLLALITLISTKYAKREMEIYGAAGAVAEEVLCSIKTVVAFDGQKKELSRYGKHLVGAMKNNLKRGFLNALSNGLLLFNINACYALSFWFGVTLILEERHLPLEQQTYTPANMVSVFFCTLMATWNFGLGAPILETFGAAKGAAQKIFAVLDSEPKIKKYMHTGKKLESFSSNITFDNVIFNYPSRPNVKILQGFNLNITNGETVALVGSSGCGKSTCIQLLQRFYDPNEGRILINNVDIKQMNLEWLRQKIAVVSQEPALFDTTIAENIRLGKLTATQHEIEEAAKKANAHKFIQNLPKGYETVLGERGAQLSGGQKQRIAIARALVRSPEVLLLDEATSALDTTSEAEVQAALDDISGTCTTIIVAHRLSTIRNANRIVVINEGTVLEMGTHAELMKKEGAYYNLVTSQGLTETEEEKVTRESKQLSRSVSIACKSIQEETEEDTNEESNITQLNLKDIICKVMKINSSEWFYIMIGCCSALVSGSALPIFGIIFGSIIGIFGDNSDDQVRNQTIMYCLCFIIVGIMMGCFTFLQILGFSISSEKLTLKIRKRAFDAMMKQEIGWFDKKENGVGALCAQLSQDAVSVQGVAGIQIGTTLNCFSTIMLTFVLSLYYEWRTTLILTTLCPLMFFSVYFEQLIMQEDAMRNQKMLEKSAKLAVEVISNIRTVVSLGCEKVFLKQYVNKLMPYQSMAKRKSHFRGLVLGMARSFMMFPYVAGISYGTNLIISGQCEYGTIFIVCEVMMVGTWSIGNALSLSPNFQKGFIAASRIFSLLEREPVVKNVEYPSKSLWENETVEYSKVEFSYPTRTSAPVLNGLSLTIPKGKTVALVGSSGCGKSTMIQLLERFYDPDSGNISINGKDTKELDLTTLRYQLGIVSQEPNLFDTTVAENIAYGANFEIVAMDKIIAAAKSANIHNFISTLPAGYGTRVGSKGTHLSGGQKQRIAIARALVRNPKILLLDEATSALDNESEKCFRFFGADKRL